MKKILCLVVLIMTFAISATNTQAQGYNAKSGFYVTPKITYGTLSMSFGDGSYSDEATGFSGAVGMDFTYTYNLPFRAEIEYSFVDSRINKTVNDYSSAQITAGTTFTLHTFFVNAYYDIYTVGNITPYFGGGVGLSFINTAGATGPFYDNGSQTDFAWNLVGGVAIPVLESFAIDISYRMTWQGSYNAIKSIRTQQIQGGLRVIF